MVAREVLLPLEHVGDRRRDGRVVRDAPRPQELAARRVVGVELRTRSQERRGALLRGALVRQVRRLVGPALPPGEDHVAARRQHAAVAVAEAVGHPGDLPFHRVVRQVDRTHPADDPVRQRRGDVRQVRRVRAGVRMSARLVLQTRVVRVRLRAVRRRRVAEDAAAACAAVDEVLTVVVRRRFRRAVDREAVRQVRHLGGADGGVAQAGRVLVDQRVAGEAALRQPGRRVVDDGHAERGAAREGLRLRQVVQRDALTRRIVRRRLGDLEVLHRTAVPCVQHVEEAALAALGDDRRHLAVDRDPEHHRRVRDVEVEPVVVGGLEEPLLRAGLPVDAQDRFRPQAPPR